MNWPDEHYVKCYTRDSLTWKTWKWETRTVLLHLLRKVDGAGFIETGRMEPAEALAIQLELPRAVVEPGLAELVACGTAEVVDRSILLTKFVEAQEARKSDAQKKRDQRQKTIDQRRAAQALENSKAHVPTASPLVTQTDPPDLPRSAQLRSTQTAAVAADQRPPPEKLAVVVTEPTAPPSAWSGADFWRWFQSKRQKAGFTAEKYPRTDPSHWFSQAMAVVEGDVELLKEAVLRFGDDRYWQAKDPPLPWAGFTSQCPPKWIPRKERPRAEG